MRRIVGVLIASAVALAVVPAAEAAFPGENGKIAYVNGGDIWTMNPDGTGQVNVTSDAPVQGSPSWSPDGSRIAFDQIDAGVTRTWHMAANGTDRVLADDGAGPIRERRDPAWSPDGTKIAATNGAALGTMNPDGSGVVAVVTGANADPDWSPAGDRITYQDTGNPENCHFARLNVVKVDGTGDQALTHDMNCDYRIEGNSWAPNADRVSFWSTAEFCPPTCADGGLFTIKPDGTDRQPVPGGGRNPAYSPDGAKFTYDNGTSIFTMHSDGTGVSGALATGTEPDWQPILRGYARPKSASPFYASLVPSYEPCTTPNRQHGAPLSFGSCNPPAQTSGFATVGTPDANSQPAKSVGSLKLKAIGEVPINTSNGNQSDLEIDVSFTDVRSKATPANDYSAGLRAQMSLQVTDKNNTPHPGGPGPATVVPASFEFDVPCAATPDTTIGGNCTLDTTANALVPGQVLEFQRAIWQLGEVAVYDGGTDTNPSTEADNTLFATQGVFIP